MFVFLGSLGSASFPVIRRLIKRKEYHTPAIIAPFIADDSMSFHITMCDVYDPNRGVSGWSGRSSYTS